MIVDRMEYAGEYAAQLPHLQHALAFIRENPDPGAGKHPFTGGYLMRQEGETRPADEGTYEAHRKYIDVQLLKEGGELLLWDRLENMTEVSAYDPEKDKHTLQGNGSVLEMRPGMFCVLFPNDAHTACRHAVGATSGRYVKYVIKLEI
jgi:biofilm protein TabA